MNCLIRTFILFSIICFNIVPAFAREQETNQALEFHRAIESGDIEKVKTIILSGIDINSRNRENWTPLHTAIHKKNKEIILLLIDKYYADVNLANNNGETSLHFAVRSGQKDVVEKLIEKGADVNILDRHSDNALSLSREGGHTEITEILLKNGAKEPSQVIDENRMNDRRRGPERDALDSEYGMENRLRPEGMQSNRANETDLLADPNEIKARIKTFEGLEKSIEEVSSKSQLGMRRWKQIRIDNKATLVNNVQRHLQEEIEFIRKVALEEQAKKAVEAADVLLAKKKDRTIKIVREIRAQVKEDQQTRSTGRGRGRSTRGSGRAGAQGNNYTERRGRRGTSRTNASDSDDEAQEPVDPEEQHEINQWLQADVQDYDSKVTLFTAINEQVMNEFSLIRQESEQEEAKKTTAAIDGLLLARKLRYDELNRVIQEEKVKLEEQEERTGRNSEEQTDNQTRGRRRRR